MKKFTLLLLTLLLLGQPLVTFAAEVETPDLSESSEVNQENLVDQLEKEKTKESLIEEKAYRK